VRNAHSRFTADPAVSEETAELYEPGLSLADVADRFGIDAKTVANRFRRAGVAIRPRRGRPSAPVCGELRGRLG
jgi:DNA-directed RNA polymerase specialized sigma24 family protein